MTYLVVLDAAVSTLLPSQFCMESTPRNTVISSPRIHVVHLRESRSKPPTDTDGLTASTMARENPMVHSGSSTRVISCITLSASRTTAVWYATAPLSVPLAARIPANTGTNSIMNSAPWVRALSTAAKLRHSGSVSTPTAANAQTNS